MFFGEGISLTLGEKRRLSALNSSVPKLFIPKREKKAGGWRALHYVDLHDLHSSPNIIRVVESRTMKGAGHAACRAWMGNLEGERSLGIARCRCLKLF